MQKHAARSPRRTGVIITAAALTAVAARPNTASAAPDQFEYFFDSSTSQGGTNAMGGFAYDPATNVFYTGGFTGATQALRKITFGGGGWTGAVQVGQTDWVNKFLASTSVAGSGVILPASFSSASTIGDIVLNPTSLTIDGVTYGPGTLGVIVDQAIVRDTSAGNAVQPQYSKNVYIYDLRAINPTPGSNSGRDRNGDGDVDWNDVFTPIVTMQDFQTVQSTINGSPATSTTVNLARSFAFASDGQSIYVNEAASTYGGIWKISLTTPGSAGMTKVVQALTGTRINTEPGVLHTSVRDLGAGGTGDQVLFQGATDLGNVGGISYVLDNGTSLQTPHTMLTGKQLAAFYDHATAAGDVGGITTDGTGNVYFMQSSDNAGVFIYDTAGRLAKVFSNAEQRAFDMSRGTTTFNNNAFDMQVRTKSIAVPGGTAVVPQVLFNDASGIRTVIGATVYKPGDFNRDNVVDAADVDLFKASLDLRGVVAGAVVSTAVRVGTGSTNTTWSDFGVAKMLFDLNGSFQTSTVSTVGDTRTTVTTWGVAIDWKDVKIFQQFAGLSDGDVDMDFDVDAADLATLAANYNGTGKLFTQGNLTSVRIAAADRDDVNFADLVTLAANWTAAKPAAGPLGAIPAADLDRAFAITAGGTISQYQAKGSGAWSNAANWTGGGVPNAPGAVASLLTKPQDDTTITLDGTYTVGQLNFDNYFTYTLTGGTLRLQGANGSAAELNAFAASPVINSAVEVNSIASVNVTYAADTVTIGGPLTVAAGQTLTKAGPGTLRLTGGGTSGGTLALTAGTTVATAPLTVGGLTLTPGTTLDLTTAGITVTSGDTSVAASLITALVSGYNGGDWNGPGINSSAAAADATDLTALGYVAGPTSFVIDYTYYGDANLDGAVDADDFALIDKGAATGASVWWLGDFNYSGTVTSDDYLLIDRSHAVLNGGVLSAPLLAQREAQFGAGYVAALVASVPEPVALPALAAAALAMASRRRRSR